MRSVLVLLIIVATAIPCAGERIESQRLSILAPDCYIPGGEFRIIIYGLVENVGFSLQGGIYGDIAPISFEALPAAGNLGGVYDFIDEYGGIDFVVGDLEDGDDSNNPADGDWIVITYLAPDIDTGGPLNFGMYDYDVAFNEPVIEFSLYSSPWPCYQLSQNEMEFSVQLGIESASQTFTIGNFGANTHLEISSDSEWLDVDVAEVMLPSLDEIDIAVNIDYENLAPGQYDGQLTVTPNGNETVNTVSVHLEVIDYCYTGSNFDEWVAVGQPESWCWPFQACADADGEREQMGKCITQIGFNDIAVLLNGFCKPYNGDPAAQPWISADFDHSEERIGKGFFRVGYNDIQILLEHFASPLGVDENGCYRY